MMENSIEEAEQNPLEERGLGRRSISLGKSRPWGNGVLAIVTLFFLAVTPAQSAESVDLSRDRADEILARIRAPEFPDREFNILYHGTVEGGEADCADAIKKAVAARRDAGGGKAVAPGGKFLTGAIHLKSSVNLHLEAEAIVALSTNTPKVII